MTIQLWIGSATLTYQDHETYDPRDKTSRSNSLPPLHPPRESTQSWNTNHSDYSPTITKAKAPFHSTVSHLTTDAESMADRSERGSSSIRIRALTIKTQPQQSEKPTRNARPPRAQQQQQICDSRPRLILDRDPHDATAGPQNVRTGLQWRGSLQ